MHYKLPPCGRYATKRAQKDAALAVLGFRWIHLFDACDQGMHKHEKCDLLVLSNGTWFTKTSGKARAAPETHASHQTEAPLANSGIMPVH